MGWFLKGIDLERGIAWRASSDSLPIRPFVLTGLDCYRAESPDHLCETVWRVMDVKTHQA